MSEDADESSKTEEPSDKKIQQARDDGNVVSSQEVKTWLVLAAALIIMVSMVPAMLTGLQRRLGYYVEHATEMAMDRGGVGGVLIRVIQDIMWALWQPILLIALAGVMGSLAQSGWMVNWGLLGPKFEKINPLAGIKRLLGSGQQMVELLKGVLKLAVVGFVAWTALQPMLASVEHFIGIDPVLLVREMGELSYRLLVGVVAVTLVIAVGDYAYQHHTWHKKMMMTRQEVKEESKQAEGDPHIKARIRAIRFERARRRMMAAVPTADVVVTNPTHFAVALKYDSQAMGAPTVVAKGVDKVALKIREVAEENDVPVVENPPLARALHASVDIDEEIPSEHYRAVAELITYVFKLKRRPLG